MGGFVKLKKKVKQKEEKVDQAKSVKQQGFT